jgi:diguanylate cyclase (GGDEF)-like protein/PAS domain S-box-containing protein
VAVYENTGQADGTPGPTPIYQWDTRGIAPARSTRTRPAKPPPRRDRDRLLAALASGKPKGLLTREAPEPLRGLFERAGAKSVLLMPLFVDNKWWGHIDFEDCRRLRAWTTAESDTLATVAEMIGAALSRARHLSELADANRVVENSSVVVFRVAATPPFPLIYVSRNVDHFGYSAADLLADPTRYIDLFHVEERQQVAADLRRIAEGQDSEIRREWRLRTGDGRYLWVDIRARALHDANRRVCEVEGILFDIDERKTAQDTLARYSLTDPVTGLPNRTAFVEEVGRVAGMTRQGGPGFAIHYIDLDRFKDVNDVLGHTQGDELLKAVAERLNALRETGGYLVARFGGDEFAILQTGVAEPSDAGAFAKQILGTLSEPFSLGTEIHITASVGISVSSPDMPNAEDMLKQADVALYRAKDAGRNQFHFHTEALDAATIERVVLGGDLRRAVERGELNLEYQPQVDVETGRMIGLEALARWHHPTRGLLGPTQFIPIAEKNGTILALGRWAVDEVCRQIVAWRAAGVDPPPVAINVSAEQLKAPQFGEDLSARLAKWRVEPGAIELELTESVLMETTREHGEVIEGLRARGVALSIDDFGTGYSSLAYLRAYRVNHIKIAQDFIEDIRADSGDIAIVRAAVSLGRELGISVIAEGVETEAQLALVRQAGCRYIQGFLYSPPVSAADAAALMRRKVLTPRPPHAATEAASP